MSELLELGPDDLAEAWQLGRLAFGGDPAAEPPTGPRASTSYGLRDDRGRLVAALRLLAYEQWWGGRLVPMTGVASVAVHPDARGQGLASRAADRGAGAHARAR